jgi:hypothetical protein
MREEDHMRLMAERGRRRLWCLVGLGSAGGAAPMAWLARQQMYSTGERESA